MDRNILAIGGFDDMPALAVVESRKVSGIGVWRGVVPMPTPRSNFAAAVLRGQVYVAGGVDGSDFFLAEVEVYNPRIGRWMTGRPLPRPRGAPGGAVLGGLLYVAGGILPLGADDGEITNSVVVYDPEKDRWRAVAPMPTARAQVRLVAAGRYLYAIGGRDDELTLPTVERYDPRSNSWRTMASMHERRAAPCVVETKVGNRHVLVVVAGAQFSAGRLVNGLRTSEIYDLATGRWKRIAPLLPAVRASMGCAVDADGAILAIGGGTRVSDVNVFLRNVDALLLTPRDIQ